MCVCVCVCVCVCMCVYIMNVNPMFHCFTTKPTNRLFKFVFNSSSENTGPVIRDHVKSSQIRNEKPLQF